MMHAVDSERSQSSHLQCTEALMHRELCNDMAMLVHDTDVVGVEAVQEQALSKCEVDSYIVSASEIILSLHQSQRNDRSVGVDISPHEVELPTVVRFHRSRIKSVALINRGVVQHDSNLLARDSIRAGAVVRVTLC